MGHQDNLGNMETSTSSMDNKMQASEHAIAVKDATQNIGRPMVKTKEMVHKSASRRATVNQCQCAGLEDQVKYRGGGVASNIRTTSPAKVR